MDGRFGYNFMKESQMIEVKLCMKRDIEFFRDFGQVIYDLYC